MKLRRSRVALGLLAALTLSCSPDAGAPTDSNAQVEADASTPPGAGEASTGDAATGPDASADVDRTVSPSSNADTDAASTLESGTGSDGGATAGGATGRSSAPRTLEGLEGLSNLRVAAKPTTTTVKAPSAVAVLQPVDGRTSFDFGVVREGDESGTEFLLVNEGEEPVAIQALNASCKCTLSDLFLVAEDGTRELYELESPIPPGARVAVRAALETISQSGAMRHSVVLILSDRTATRLELMAHVTPFLETDPSNGVIVIGNLKASESRAGSLTLRASSGEPIGLSYVPEEVPEYFHPTLTPIEPDADGRAVRWRLDVVAGPGVPEIQQRPAAFFLRSDVAMPIEPKDGQPAEFSKRVVVSASVTPAVLATPNFVSLGLFQVGDEKSAVVEIEFTDDHVAQGDPTVRIEWGASQVDTAALAPYLSASVVALDEGTNWRLEVLLEPYPETLAGTFQGRFVLELDHPSRSELVVPFSGVARSSSQPAAKQPAQPGPKG